MASVGIGLSGLNRRIWSGLSQSWSRIRREPVRPGMVGSDRIAAEAAAGHPEHPARAEFKFEDADGLTHGKREQFKEDFARELARLARWSEEHGWLPSRPSRFQVAVSARYKISKSLVPSWYGRAGDMQFPAWRVIDRKAAIAHELVHVYFPNANRLLAEGLAIHLQAEIGGNPAFPNFGKPLHALAFDQVTSGPAAETRGDARDFGAVHLADLDAIATPNPLELNVGRHFYGEDARGQAYVYSLAGSFVQFLVEAYGLEKFARLYALTPFIPLAQNAGSARRWIGVYGLSLADLEDQWKLLLGGAEARNRS